MVEVGSKFTAYDFTGALGAQNIGVLTTVVSCRTSRLLAVRSLRAPTWSSFMRATSHCRVTSDGCATMAPLGTNNEAYQVAATHGCIALIQALRDEDCQIDARHAQSNHL